MRKFLESILGYWEMWHLALAFPAYIIFFNWQNGDKQLAFMLTMGLALTWEILELFWEISKGFKSYGGNWRRFFLNSMKDMLAALLASLTCTFLLQ